MIGKKNSNLDNEMPLVSDDYHLEVDPNCEVRGRE